MGDCVFCGLPQEATFAENDLFRAIYDRNPVSKGHALIISKRHVTNIFEAKPEEMAAIGELLKQVKGMLDEEYHPDGYNVVANVGTVAGQTVFHLHLHVIPRYQGDKDILKWDVQ
ncbi:HIT family hydrolase, diadenosine tetraphosphate hydrolase [Desulfosporosinus acidiphilus SJ4]|uniref:HIT family hydrolase, diadenosine tetraphosphate hydrolase n=1 Tax=Desulfosporosinus acidiphilus (strain DSM 22704 / JCM 16185 / SJ4) TaxID=646529 RepID=I4D2V1_DESAJ|nr:HIT family protein [Desulfosporosinus acidiphilus]AFM40125.1 HIT family hydrolase, diadenosine tetraphosphate hydrolase [Desulfosporosinus acidiphilus SJ4]